jgi:hypothetical protein
MHQSEIDLLPPPPTMLLFCASDMHHAKVAARAWAERPGNDAIHRILQTAMIVIYARPFTRSEFFDLKNAGRDYRPADEALAALHDDLLDMRHRAIAHTDKPSKSRRSIEVAAAGSAFGMEEEYAVFTRDSLEALLTLFESQKIRFETDALRINRELAGQ